MAFQPFYTVTDWQNLPLQKTALNRTNLLHSEQGIKEADNRIVQLDAKKAEQSIVNKLVSGVTLNTETGVLTVTLLNGTVVTYDLDIEKVVINFDITDDNILVLTLADGTTKEVDLTKFVNNFENTATISMHVQDRIVTATIIDGSVTMGKLDAAIQAEFRQCLLDAQGARDDALQYQKFAKRYALGDEEYPGSEDDNAKAYYEQSKICAGTAKADAQTATASAETATDKATIASQKAASASASATSAAGDAQLASTKATEAMGSAVAARESEQGAREHANLSVAKAEEALNSALESESWAAGGTGSREGEDGNNSKYHAEKSKEDANRASVEADRAAQYADIVAPGFHVDTETMVLYMKAGVGIDFVVDENNVIYWKVA